MLTIYFKAFHHNPHLNMNWLLIENSSFLPWAIKFWVHDVRCACVASVLHGSGSVLQWEASCTWIPLPPPTRAILDPSSQPSTHGSYHILSHLSTLPRAEGLLCVPQSLATSPRSWLIYSAEMGSGMSLDANGRLSFWGLEICLRNFIRTLKVCWV
jgi:hypothetical protein